MKIELFKRDNGEVFFKLESDATEYAFDEKGMFKYIDCIIVNNYNKIDISFDINCKDLKPYASLFDEIYKEISNPDNKFKEAYNRLIETVKKDKESTDKIDNLFSKNDS